MLKLNFTQRFALIVAHVLILSGCNMNDPSGYFAQAPATISTTPNGVANGPSNSTTAVTLRNMKPALAVRGMACLMCHANVQANIVTDFGNGEPWFMSSSGGNYGVNFESDQGWYNDLANSWQTATIQGSVYVPALNVPSTVLDNLGVNAQGQTLSLPNQSSTPMSIASFMDTPYTSYDTFGYEVGIEDQSAMDYGVTPQTPGASKVIATQTIRISNFEDSDILALFPGAVNTQAVGFTAVAVNGIDDVVLSGLQVAGNTATGQYVTNQPNQPLICQGADVVVQGPLFLNNVSINADNGGCRFYVAGSVFIEGPIQFVGVAASDNLQITSSRIISMGVGSGYSNAEAGNCYPSCNALEYRLFDDFRGAQVSGTSFTDRALQISTDAATIGFLQDAQDMSGVNYATGITYSGASRASIDYSHVLFNAPIIYSRYLGVLKGTMISDIALFSLGEFHFEYDDVFESVPVFPLLPLSPLDVE